MQWSCMFLSSQRLMSLLTNGNVGKKGRFTDSSTKLAVFGFKSATYIHRYEKSPDPCPRKARARAKDTRSCEGVWSYSDAAQASFLVPLRTLVSMRVLKPRIHAHADPCKEHEASCVRFLLAFNRLTLLVLRVHLYYSEWGQADERRR